MFQRIRGSLLADQQGLTTVEYVIVLCLIAALAVGTWSRLGGEVEDYLARAADKIGTNVNDGLNR